MSYCFFLVFWLTLLLSITAVNVEFRSTPQAMTVLLGAPDAEFYCKTFASTHDWIVNGSQLILTQSGPHRQRGIRRCLARQLVGSEFDTKLCVRTSEMNNNTVVQCSLSESMQSEPVLLRIQGLLAAPPDLTATALNSSTIHLACSPPFTLNISGAQPSIVGYNVVIEDDNQEVILTVNTSLTAFDYTLDDHEFCRTYEVKVAGINGVGIGEYCRSVNLTLRYPILLSPNLSTDFLNSTSQFSCEAHCYDSLLLTLILINGSTLGYSQLRVNQSNSDVQCNDSTANPCIATLEIMPVLLGHSTVQCAAVYACGPGEAEFSSCQPRMCYSPPMSINIEGPFVNTSVENTESTEDLDESSISTGADTATENISTVVIPIPMEKSLFSRLGLTIATASGITAFFSILIILILSIVVCREFKRKGKKAVTELPGTSNAEVIYEQCGDPTAATLGTQNTNATMVIYDSPKSKCPQPPFVTHPCVAYDSTHHIPLQPMES